MTLALSRASAAAAVDRMGLAGAALAMRRLASPWMSPWISVLTYHRVAHPQDVTPLDEDVVDVTPAQFERQLSFITRWFEPIGIDDLGAFAGGRRGLPRNPVMITFDDGYRDNHDVALPILLRHGVRAVFFVATDYVERRRLYWWDRASLIIKRSQREDLELAHPGAVLSLRGAEARRVALRRVQRIIKDSAGLDVERFLLDLARAAGVTLARAEERAIANATVMTWAQIASLRKAGMDVQSHSHTHRVFHTLAADDLRVELTTSRALIEAHVGAPVRALAYPVGRPPGAGVRRLVREAGYELAFSNATGVNRRGALDPLAVRRLAMEMDLGERFFRATLAIPWLAH